MRPKPILSGCSVMVARIDITSEEILVGPHRLRALLGVPPVSTGIVIFAHGSGSGRLSPRNNHVAAALRMHGQATLLLDLLTHEEELHRRNVFDVELLADRLRSATKWVRNNSELRHLPIGYFGASTGAAAALIAAADDAAIAALVSRGGRPDMACAALPSVRAPTLLLVGSLDGPVITLNQQAFMALTCPKKILIVPGAGHLFEEPGTLDQVIAHARKWFAIHFAHYKEGEQ
ncbi:dienelactone hydrolase family protein [Sphingorhabdus sp.]|uniref:dienelactone hydrolase family protein n=1 Tax=Sphingorhabdus sp. TaxID=1902408 RepID=UPI0025FC99DA|nr:dienelactone hydrolase family protein [Sphingorhabdus sp.]